MNFLLFPLCLNVARYRKDLRKPFDVSLKGSFRLINAVIPPVGCTKKDTLSVYTVTACEREKNGGEFISSCIVGRASILIRTL